MGKPETLMSLIHEDEARKQQQAEKETLKAEKKNQNRDQVITLNLENRNQSRESSRVLPALRDKIKEVGSWLAKRFKSSRENPSLGQVIKEARLQTMEDKASSATEQAEGQVRTMEAKGKALGGQQAEITAIAREVKMADFYEPSEGQKADMGKLADMILRAGPKVEGGFGKLVDGLKAGNLSKELKQQAVAVIEQLMQGHSWGKENEVMLTNLKWDFKAGSESEKPNQQEGMGDVLESYAGSQVELNKRNGAYGELGRLIIEQNPLMSGNKSLGEAFLKGEPSQEDLRNGLKAIDAIKKLARWPKAVLAELEEAKSYIDKELGVPGKSEKVVNISRRKPRAEQKGIGIAA
jgi:hypothetical protein